MKIKWIKLILVREEVKPNLPQECPFFVTYHLRLKALGKVIHENLNLLYMNDEVKDNFTLEPMVSFRTAENLVVIWLEPNYAY